MCNNPSGECECPRPEFCKWYGPLKKPKSKGFKKSKSPSLRKTKLKPRSKKQYRYNRIYLVLKDAWLPNKRCAVHPEKEAGQVHHIISRSVKEFHDDWAKERDVPYLIDIRFWLPVSQEGHAWIHSHPKESKENGWLQSNV